MADIRNRYRLFELELTESKRLPLAPGADEKYLYACRNNTVLIFFSVVSFGAISVSMFGFIVSHPLLWPLLEFYFLTIMYFVISLGVNIFTRSFDLAAHKKLVREWKPVRRPAVDVFLPTAGEPLEVLENTWIGVREMASHYGGGVRVYCLDDSARSSVRELANSFGFKYSSRPNRGEHKKAGNLRHGFKISSGVAIAIFDADFRPREDFLNELMPYFYKYPRAGIVQSPQYFDVCPEQNWLERGAGAVQELFYRSSQVARQSLDASICVGSNAIYRRAALTSIGGTALIEHSEDVHTGFNMRMKGWTIVYVPVLLAKGLCPSSMTAFFKQQYRWCMGSMSLLSSSKFWAAKLSLRSRMAYMSGFMYYICTGIGSLFAPIIPLALLLLYPGEIRLINYVLIIPAIVFTQVVYPMWHKVTYGIEAWATRSVYGWAHLFSITDAITGRAMGWQPTGAKVYKDRRYVTFRILQATCNLVPAIIWVGVAALRFAYRWDLNYLPILMTGIYYLAICGKVTFSSERSYSLGRIWSGLGKRLVSRSV